MKSHKIIACAIVVLILLMASCNDDDLSRDSLRDIPTATVKIDGQAVIKAIPTNYGWVILKETLQEQFRITKPKREIAWTNNDFVETRNYKNDADWSLNDLTVHPSGDVSAIATMVEFKGGPDYLIRIKLLRFKSGGLVIEQELASMPRETEDLPYFPGSIDRAKVVALGEEVYVVARWRNNDVQAHRISFADDKFNVEWQTLVEPEHFVGTMGIIGGGFDNFRQGDRYFFIYADVDNGGNLHIAVPSSEELLISHDEHFGENLLAGTDPVGYNFGAVIHTRLTPSGSRMYSKVQGTSRDTRIINMRAANDGIYFVGRMKTGLNPNSWDAWVLKANIWSGAQIYENTIDIRDGDMFWSIDGIRDGGAVAVGTTDYTQNPAGLSVSNERNAAAFVLDAQGRITKELKLPQGPSGRGNETMFVSTIDSKKVILAGVHNAPGTHAAIYCDGFVAVRNLANQED